MEQNKALEKMLADRATWERWEPSSYCHAKFANEPAFRVDETLGLANDKSRFDLQARKRGTHMGAFDKLKKRWVVLRTTNTASGWSSSQIWELEVQKNKSRAYRRYRGLNERWKQDTRPLREYKVDVNEGENLGFELQHYGHDDRASVARVGMLVIASGDHHYARGTTVQRITGITPDGGHLLVTPIFSLDGRALFNLDGSSDKDATRSNPKGLRLVTMAQCMDWIMRIKAFMRECQV